MFYTITFSPSIDYVIISDQQLNINGLNRIDNYDFFPGGKGINASVILKRIGFQNKAFCFSGGDTFSLFDCLLKKERINFHNIKTKDNTRINMKYYDGKHQFEINGKKPDITKNQFSLLEKQIDKLKVDDVVFIMGKCEDSYLLKIVEKLFKKKIKFVLDIDSKILLKLIKFNPLAIKPNIHELEMILDKKINKEQDIYDAMIFLKTNGVENIIVSNGSKGSYLLSNDYLFYKISFPKIDNIISTVGAGDTLLSSFVAFLLKTNNYVDSIKKATALSIGTSCSN